MNNDFSDAGIPQALSVELRKKRQETCVCVTFTQGLDQVWSRKGDPYKPPGRKDSRRREIG